MNPPVFDYERDLRQIEQAREDKEMTEDYSSGQRITNRPDDPRKQAFIDRFLAEDRIDAYPFLEQDIRHENRCVLYKDESGGSLVFREVFEAEVQVAYDHCGWDGGPNPSAVVTDLLASSSSNRLLRIGALPFELISVELVLAHLQTLGFNFPPRLAATIARRATILLLNARHMS